MQTMASIIPGMSDSSAKEALSRQAAIANAVAAETASRPGASAAALLSRVAAEANCSEAEVRATLQNYEMFKSAVRKMVRYSSPDFIPSNRLRTSVNARQ